MSNNESTTKVPLPEVQAYLDAKSGAQKAYDDGVAKINADPRFRIGVLEDRYGDNWQAKHAEARAAREELERAYFDAPNKAWADHLVTSTNPMVKYIADNAQGYPAEADQVLKLLPATREELDAYAASKDWCREWVRLADAAEAAGVFPPDNTPAAYKEVRRYVLRNVRTDRIGSVMRKVDAAIAEAVEAALAAAAVPALEDVTE